MPRPRPLHPAFQKDRGRLQQLSSSSLPQHGSAWTSAAPRPALPRAVPCDSPRQAPRCRCALHAATRWAWWAWVLAPFFSSRPQPGFSARNRPISQCLFFFSLLAPHRPAPASGRKKPPPRRPPPGLFLFPTRRSPGRRPWTRPTLRAAAGPLPRFWLHAHAPADLDVAPARRPAGRGRGVAIDPGGLAAVAGAPPRPRGAQTRGEGRQIRMYPRPPGQFPRLQIHRCPNRSTDARTDRSRTNHAETDRTGPQHRSREKQTLPDSPGSNDHSHDQRPHQIYTHPPRPLLTLQLVKISDTLLFPCLAAPETLRLDVYSATAAASRDYSFAGTVTRRLSVLSDPKQIKEHGRVEALAPPAPPRAANPAGPGRAALPRHGQPSSIGLKAYCFTASDAPADRVTKFVSLLALGPMTRPAIEDRLQLARFVLPAQADLLFASHTQPYWRKDTFTDSDVYPLAAGAAPDAALHKLYVILKDKAYKELRPWQWHAYTDFERTLIIDNCHHALGRQGFLDTHPLRRRIVERGSPPRSANRAAALGGGLLVSSAKKPPPPASLLEPAVPGPGSPLSQTSASARASTESPTLSSEARKRFARKAGAARPTLAQGTAAALSLSSDDEKLAKGAAARMKRRANSGTQGSRSVTSNASYTLPSSVNDEHALDPSDPDTRPAGAAKPAASLPSRPSSSFSSHDKKQQYYSQLADKFRLRYKEYERLHRQLSRDSRKNSHAEKKKSLVKLHELHNSLSEWKRRLWDYHNENNMAEGVMTLSKHRKLNSSSRISALAPLTSKVSSAERFSAAPGGLGAGPVDSMRKQASRERQPGPRAKIALDY
ncbi:hypothetical protein METBIDRAFT_190362 [Metschnikowia bicuspidata var. bicuspidata NRRL YB-4993]|uniref:Uncharacterized protein n=1 Tax=Metschnikowia bicuspidata var. bicuspidata NRRL YB-4993 TaxID=869754 RepID=A0A1A0HCD4_9ASCO|nr:hypothetical protein METBIDRAFT_190362 [Metschnikowia bicuspidata var. bicuspidata NRRL YB-4993]OBA21660.1 hypothetical protein METBIDRAFT_190362 [Metschnikowia bicuspidata var. bicuspidata NRRL YB-4993]